MSDPAQAQGAHEVAERAWGHPEPAPVVWRRGPWTIERRGDELADIAYDGSRVLRAVRAVARDRDWGTVPAEVAEVREDGDRLELGLRLAGLGADIRGHLVVEADGDQLRIAFSGISHTDFDRNRVGLVMLHPPSAVGVRLDVTSPDGSHTSTVFPERIAPHQPARDIAGLGWVDGGVAITARFAGEVFEMEDQRNWTDASFKTYSTPLDLPFPVRLAKGERVEQAVMIECRRVTPDTRTASDALPRPIEVDLVDAGRPFPQLALGASTAPGAVPGAPGRPPAEALLVELDTRSGAWSAALARAAEEAGGLPLDVRIVAQTPRAVGPVVAALAAHPVARLGVFSAGSQVSEPDLWEALTVAVSRHGVGAQLLGGARSHFTELNRTHERLPDVPALTFSVTPQMHAVERAQLVESIGMQRLVAEGAVRIAAGRPVHVGPITLRPRFNAVATTPSTPAAGAETSPVADGYGAHLVDGATDPRQGSDALAAWTVASAAALAVDGVASLTYFETWGPRGVVDSDGTPYPVATAIGWLHQLAGHRMLIPASPLPDGVWVVGAAGPEPTGRMVLAANLRSEPVSVRVGDGPAQELAPLSVAVG